MSAQADSHKLIRHVLAANFLIAIAKLAAAVYTGSGTVLAQAVHSFADCCNQGLLAWGLKSAKPLPSLDYPPGWGKAIYYWSYIAAIIIFSLGGLFVVHEGLHKLGEPEQMEAPLLAIGVLWLSAVVALVALWRCLRHIGRLRGSIPLLRWARLNHQHELLLLLGETVADLAGIGLALFSVSLSILSENPLFDALGCMAIGLLLLALSLLVGVAVRGLLLGRRAAPELTEAISRYLEADQAVGRVQELLSLQLGEQVLVAIKAELVAETVEQLAAEQARLEAGLKAAYPQIARLFLQVCPLAVSAPPPD
ncbi:cation diffusion facilitator family transporter [Chitinimonas arctica]|uniref:Cation diffusion facilitator family transporter n=1 Tax=Chitinimonas arctica TaxID=2594795 RepID=A0A516SFK7_9NEIS|nr:cation diffusion facilitator family transporter [Chitinimonas arctica]QDQ26939.1 cation diffusion facilitator family transporter [Chitinimonas arctica]